MCQALLKAPDRAKGDRGRSVPSLVGLMWKVNWASEKLDKNRRKGWGKCVQAEGTRFLMCKPAVLVERS